MAGTVEPMDEPFPEALTARYEPIRQLGRGGFGQVVLVRDRKLARTAALKLMREGLADPVERTRFEREAQALAALRHPGIPALYDAETLPDGRPWIAMEFLAGGSAAARLARLGPFPEETVRNWGRILAEALEAVHGEGILHRDLKPENVLLRGPDGPPLLGDFGLALGHEPRLTREGMIVGTPATMAPEILAGQSPGREADQFSLAATLFELATGETIWGQREPLEVVRASTRVDPAARARERLPGTLGAVLARAMARDPSRRFPDAGTLARELGGEPAEDAWTGSERDGDPFRTAPTASMPAFPDPRSALEATREGPAGYQDEETRAVRAEGSGSRPAGRLPVVMAVSIGLGILSFLGLPGFRRGSGPGTIGTGTVVPPVQATVDARLEAILADLRTQTDQIAAGHHDTAGRLSLFRDETRSLHARQAAAGFEKPEFLDRYRRMVVTARQALEAAPVGKASPAVPEVIRSIELLLHLIEDLRAVAEGSERHIPDAFGQAPEQFDAIERQRARVDSASITAATLVGPLIEVEGPDRSPALSAAASLESIIRLEGDPRVLDAIDAAIETPVPDQGFRDLQRRLPELAAKYLRLEMISCDRAFDLFRRTRGSLERSRSGPGVFQIWILGGLLADWSYLHGKCPDLEVAAEAERLADLATGLPPHRDLRGVLDETGKWIGELERRGEPIPPGLARLRDEVGPKVP